MSPRVRTLGLGLCSLQPVKSLPASKVGFFLLLPVCYYKMDPVVAKLLLVAFLIPRCRPFLEMCFPRLHHKGDFIGQSHCSVFAYICITQSDWPTEPSLPEKLEMSQHFDASIGADRIDAPTMHFGSGRCKAKEIRQRTRLV